MVYCFSVWPPGGWPQGVCLHSGGASGESGPSGTLQCLIQYYVQFVVRVSLGVKFERVGLSWECQGEENVHTCMRITEQFSSGKMLRGWFDSEESIAEASVHSAPLTIACTDYSYIWQHENPFRTCCTGEVTHTPALFLSWFMDATIQPIGLLSASKLTTG